MCGYLEVSSNFTSLFGDGAKTTVGSPKLTKSAAFDVFAIHMNNHNKRLHLSGRQLQQRFTTYKKKYLKAKSFEENTGAGIEEGDGMPTLSSLLESMCPCYFRMDKIFGQKANVTAMREFDSTNEEHILQSPRLSEEIPFEGWEATQDTSIIPPLDDDNPDSGDESLNIVDNSPETLFSNKGKNPSAQCSTPHISNKRSLSGPLELHSNKRSHSGPSDFHKSRNVSSKGKSSLVSAFENSTVMKMDFLEAQMTWEKEKYNRKEEKEEMEKIEQANLRKEKKEFVEKLLNDGKSPQEIEALIKMIYSS